MDNRTTNVDLMIFDKTLRMELVNIRKSKRITQKQLAEMTGLSESCISNIEQNLNVSPTLRSIISYCNALGVDINLNISKH